MLNRKAHMDFNVLKKLNVGEEAIDLLKKMLSRDSKNRISAEEALLHPYFNTNRLKLSMEEEEFSLGLNEVDQNIEKNMPSFQFSKNLNYFLFNFKNRGKFDFSGKNYCILCQSEKEKPKEEKGATFIENCDANPCFIRENVMNGNLDTLHDIALHEFMSINSFVGVEGLKKIPDAGLGSQRID